MSMKTFQKLFNNVKLPVIAMIHVEPLAGTPLNKLSTKEIVNSAMKELEIYARSDVDGVLIENMWDLPYIKADKIGPEIVAQMTRISTEIRKNLPPNIPCGLQILAGCNKEAIAVSQAAGLQFARCEGFVFSHVADEGWIDACAGDLLRYRKHIGANDVLVFTDIKKKHSAHAVTGDVSIAETAKAAEFFLSDGLILTGESTGSETNPQEVEDVRKNCNLPVLIGSGITLENVEKFKAANGLIVGSYFKRNGRWNEEIEESKVAEFVKKVRSMSN